MSYTWFLELYNWRQPRGGLKGDDGWHEVVMEMMDTWMHTLWLWEQMLMCGYLHHHFWVVMTASSYVGIQMITFVNAYDVGREGTIVTIVYLCTTIFVFHSYGLIIILCIVLWMMKWKWRWMIMVGKDSSFMKNKSVWSWKWLIIKVP